VDIDDEGLNALDMGYQEVHEVPHPLFFSCIIRIFLGTADDSDMESIVV